MKLQIPRPVTLQNSKVAILGCAKALVGRNDAYFEGCFCPENFQGFFHDAELELWQEHVWKKRGYLHVTQGAFIHRLVVMKKNHGDATAS